jgi:hypothetical protein
LSFSFIFTVIVPRLKRTIANDHIPQSTFLSGLTDDLQK